MKHAKERIRAREKAEDLAKSRAKDHEEIRDAKLAEKEARRQAVLQRRKAQAKSREKNQRLKELRGEAKRSAHFLRDSCATEIQRRNAKGAKRKRKVL